MGLYINGDLIDLVIVTIFQVGLLTEAMVFELDLIAFKFVFILKFKLTRKLRTKRYALCFVGFSSGATCLYFFALCLRMDRCG